MTAVAPNQLIGGRYRLQRRLGAGGMAAVWLAIDERLGRSVAIKIMADTLAGDGEWLRRFEREARAAASISHPHVVSVFDYGVGHGRPFIAMEYLPGGTLRDRLASAHAGSLDPATAAFQLLGALQAVHAAGIIHRDVNARNILLGEHGHLHLTDFGIALPADATQLTQTGMVIGTLGYMAPEVAAGGAATVRSDLYSAGLLIGELVEIRPTPQLTVLVEALTAPSPAQRPESATRALALLAETDRTAATAVQATRIRTPRRRPPGRRRPSSEATTMTRRIGHGAATGADRLAGVTRLMGVARQPSGARLSAAGAILALVAACVLLVALIGGGSSAGPRHAQLPAVARASAPLSQQLNSLARMVQAARSRR